MIAEVGHLCLILAMALAVLLATLPTVGVIRGWSLWMQSAGSLAAGMLVFCAFAFACLTATFLQDDFSVRYVASHSNASLPLQYKVSAVWGGHEGSFLLWTLVLCAWTFAVATLARDLTPDMRARVLAVLGGLGSGFFAFMLGTSNPFDRNLPIYPENGSDLNPLLQDFGLIVHPPMLYMGYVGFAVPFAFAIATLWSGRLDTAWARWSRPWTNAAWAFLTIGITLGSWWAYYELGWGGWWFWDAVENASFLPWLVGTALIHSLAASEKRGVFKSWTVLLAIAAFSLSLLGGFLVRSGVLTSVHAFAVDPERGLFMLVFFAVVVGASLALYALRAGRIESNVVFAPSGREVLLLLNNVILVVAAGSILYGTLKPLIYEAISGGAKLSVGPPWFNSVFVPLMLLLFVFLAVSPRSRWRETPLAGLLMQQAVLLGGASVVTLIAFVTLGRIEFMLVLPVALALWITANLALDLYAKLRTRTGFRAPWRLNPSWIGMFLGHLGIAAAAIGVTVTVFFSTERDLRMTAGDAVDLEGYTFTLQSVDRVRGPNYAADRGTVVVTRGGEQVVILYPEKRVYDAGGQTMTEAAMDAGLIRDLYVALGEPLDDAGAWSVRVHYKPFVRWIWLGGLMVAAGGFVTLLDRRYRRRRAAARELADDADGGEGTDQDASLSPPVVPS